jgi:outer membrane receptor for ferrienterochelin and colicins
MRFCISLVAIFGSAVWSFSQEIKVVDSDLKTPVENARIALRCIASGEIQTYQSDKKGIVLLPSNQVCKEFELSINHNSYEPFKTTYSVTETKTFEIDSKSGKIDEVVITAQYTPGIAEKAVQKIKVIDRKTIDQMGAQNLKDVLSNQMNIRLSQDNILGSSMSLQGISGQNVKILIDGVAVTGRVNGNIDISQINMNNVERIEIVEGPLSVNYGTDALAGTINIITKKFQKPSTSVSVSSYYESGGQYNFSGRLAHSTSKYTFSLLGGRNYFDGWKTADKPFLIEQEMVADSNRVKDWKPKEQYFATFFAGRKIKNLQLGFTSDYFYEQIMNRGMPRAPYFETAFDDYYTTNRLSNSVTLNGKLVPNGSVNVVFAYNYYQRIKNTFIKDLTTLDQNLTATPSDQDTSKFLNFTARGSYATAYANSKINGEIGYDLQHETGLGIRIKDGSQEIGDYAVFASAEYKPYERLTLRPGIRAMYNTAYKTPLIPSFNAKLDVGKHSFVRASYARGFRAPSLKDLYFYFVDINHNIQGNPDLKAENSHNFSASYNTRFTWKNTQWKFENSYFYNTIENLISLAQVTSTEYSYFNLSRYKSLGVQLQAEMSWKNLTTTLGGSYVGRYNELSETFDSKAFTYSPEGRLNLQYAWTKRAVVFSVFYKYTGVTPGFTLDENNQLLTTTVSDYHMMDCSVSKSFYKKRVMLVLGSKNIFNVKSISGTTVGSAHASSSNSIPLAMGRTFFVKLDINLTTRAK